VCVCDWDCTRMKWDEMFRKCFCVCRWKLIIHDYTWLQVLCRSRVVATFLRCFCVCVSVDEDWIHEAAGTVQISGTDAALCVTSQSHDGLPGNFTVLMEKMDSCAVDFITLTYSLVPLAPCLQWYIITFSTPRRHSSMTQRTTVWAYTTDRRRPWNKCRLNHWSA